LVAVVVVFEWLVVETLVGKTVKVGRGEEEGEGRSLLEEGVGGNGVEGNGLSVVDGKRVLLLFLLLEVVVVCCQRVPCLVV
jgi:hypothetical protein